MDRSPLSRPIVLAGALSLALAAALVAGCGGSSSTTQRTLTERERDSTLGRSAIPGAGVVTRALEASDQAAASARAMDAQVDSLTR